jgi:hypothetical protein
MKDKLNSINKRIAKFNIAIAFCAGASIGLVIVLIILK